MGKNSIYRKIFDIVIGIDTQSSEIKASIKCLINLMEQNKIEIEKLNCTVSDMSLKISALEEKINDNDNISAEQVKKTIKALESVGKSLNDNNKIFNESIGKIMDMNLSAAAEYRACVSSAINSVMADNMMNLIP